MDTDPKSSNRAQPSNREKDPDEWVTGDETMTGAQASFTDTDGKPDFQALHFKSAAENLVEVWCFDLLEINGLDLRSLPLVERKEKLAAVLACATDNLRYSEVFADPGKLLDACEQKLLEGIVSKRSDAPYRSGKSDWIKVKCESWREANKERGELFAK